MAVLWELPATEIASDVIERDILVDTLRGDGLFGSGISVVVVVVGGGGGGGPTELFRHIMCHHYWRLCCSSSVHTRKVAATFLSDLLPALFLMPLPT